GEKMSSPLWKRLFGLFRASRATRRAEAARRRKQPRPFPRLEVLEDRLAPATSITVIPGAAGSGTLDHFLDATHGTITVADDPGDAAATLSTGALAGVGST